MKLLTELIIIESLSSNKKNALEFHQLMIDQEDEPNHSYLRDVKVKFSNGADDATDIYMTFDFDPWIKDYKVIVDSSGFHALMDPSSGAEWDLEETVPKAFNQLIKQGALLCSQLCHDIEHADFDGDEFSGTNCELVNGMITVTGNYDGEKVGHEGEPITFKLVWNDDVRGWDCRMTWAFTTSSPRKTPDEVIAWLRDTLDDFKTQAEYDQER